MANTPFKLQVNRSAEAVKEAGNAFISQSGIYPITINFVSLSKSAGGAVSFNINYDYQGNAGTIYGPTIQNKNGDENTIGYRVLNKLFVIAGLEHGQEPTIDEETHSVGKDNEAKVFNVITELSGVSLQMQVKEEYNKYKGDIKKSTNPINFFTDEGATADEILAKEAGNEVTMGSQLAKIKDKPETTKHRLGKDENKQPVTQEEVDAFITAKKSGNSTTAAPAVKPKTNLFK